VVKYARITGVLAVCAVIMACAPGLQPEKPTVGLQRLQKADYPRFKDDLNYRDLRAGIEMSLAYLRRRPAGTRIAFGPDQYEVRHLIRSLETFMDLVESRPSPTQLNQVLRARFAVYQSTAPSVLFTGYYEPLLEGSLTPSTRYPVPVHSRPKDLVRVDLGQFDPELKGRRIVGRFDGRALVPYPERAQIQWDPDFNRIAAPIAWLRDETDLFILQVQGSGKILLETGDFFHIQFDAHNGRPYRSIGRLLIDQGKISPQKMSMESIRTYLRQNPVEAQAVMSHNPRYIFFREGQGQALGSLGVGLTPRRSIAVDHRLFPSAAMAFFQTRVADVNADGVIRQWQDYQGFALAQDAGGAIKGPGRVDWFMGDGLQAEVAASHLKHPGQLYFLILQN
jgi:membrane-bound lytic murein transglycosylase A